MLKKFWKVCEPQRLCKNMEIGFVTDEISPDVTEAIEIGVSWGVFNYELRGVGEHRIPAIDETDIQQILALIKKHGIRITALSPGIFKGTLQESDRIEHEIKEILPATFRLAERLNSDMVLVFGFKRAPNDQEDDEHRVVELFTRVAETARQHGFIIAVENEPGFWCDTGTYTARILAKVNSPFLRANWDPANAVGTGETPFPDGYLAIKDWIANIHIKDTVKSASVACVPVGEGVVDWQGQLAAILRDKPVKHITIETHCLPMIENSKQNLRVVRKMIAAAIQSS